MNLEIYDEVKKNKSIIFKLEKGADSIILMVCDEKGNRVEGGNILYISSSGKLKLCAGINKNIGLYLTEEGKLKLG